MGPGSAPDRCPCGGTGEPLAGLPRQTRREAAMPEYRRILLDGSVVQVRREGDDLLAGDGRRGAASGALPPTPVAPTQIIAGPLKPHPPVAEIWPTRPPAPSHFPHPGSRLWGRS